jgi:DNA segregation ATPase FtsK/SpoIIIE-like protein
MSALHALLHGLLHLARPRSAIQFLTLVLTILGATSAIAGIYSYLTGSGEAALYWAAILGIAAIVCRVSPASATWMRGLTLRRLRLTVGLILVLAALVLVTGAIVARSIGSTTTPFLGPLSQPWRAYPLMALLLLSGLSVAFAGARFVTTMHWLRATLVRQVHSPRFPVAAVRSRVTRETYIVTEDMLHTLPQAEDELPTLLDTPLVMSAGHAVKVIEESVLASTPTKATDRRGSLNLPPIDIFVKPTKNGGGSIDLDNKARIIEQKLASFGVGAHVVGYHCGPTVTLFDVEPDPGVKVRRITELQNDLALALAAPTIRIQAPVPGRPVVGIEVPNTAATMVSMREILESEAYRAIHSPLRVVLGKDVTGSAVCIDLATLPHLLIAGATGSGKSVCLNVIISCLLYQNTPEDVRLLMVDPKMVELSVYNGIPHLLSPVVTDMNKIVGALRWTIREMERRYALFRDAGVRNLARYNQKLAEQGGSADTKQKKLPYIVVIIDELADLMMVAPDDVEENICRLAQLARATGIHLVIATQRPSVDVVTGLIKANFPARIAFAMSSQVDSRTILDQVGAEKLLGRGDMLYQDPRMPKPVRLQGAFLSDREIERLVEFWQGAGLQVDQVSDAEFEARAREESAAEDQLLAQAIEVVREHKRASVSLLQRRLSIGWQRAARLMDLLEERGIVSTADGGKSRAVLESSEPDQS